MSKPARKNPLSDEEQKPRTEMGKGLAELLKGGKPPYSPVLKSLEQIGLEPELRSINLHGTGEIQCFVIPAQDLVYKEWQYMTQSSFGVVDSPQREELKDGEQ